MEYKLNEKLIKDLREGRIALKHNMKDEELLKEVIKVAFPNDRDTPKGTTTYYFKTKINQNWWFSSTTTLPTVPLLDFIEKEEYKFTVDYVSKNKVAICINTIEDKYKIQQIKGFEGYLVHKTGGWSADKEYLIKNNYEIIEASDFIKNNTKTMDKEIIGYKVPFDISNGWKKGDVAITTTADKEYWISNKYGRIPKEIVETWEPVYKTSEKVLTLSNDKTIKISKGKIEAQGRDIPIDSIEKLLRPYLSTVGGWGVELKDAKYKIGCYENVTLADIKLILKEYEELNK